MKKLSMIILFMFFICSSGTRAQSIFNGFWGSTGITISRPEVYRLNFVTAQDDDDYFNLYNETKDITGLFLGLKVNLFEIKDYFYFGPSLYYLHFFPEIQYEEGGAEDIYYQEIDYTISDFSINGDFYFKLLKRERSIYAGLGVGIHDVRFRTKFFLDPPRDIPYFPEFDPEENNEIDESEKKVAFHLIGKVDLSEKISLEARFEFMSELNQFKIVWAYNFWRRRESPE